MYGVNMREKETECRAEQSPDTTASCPGSRLHVGPSDAQPPTLCSAAAFSLCAHGSRSTHAHMHSHPHLEAPEVPAAPSLTPPSLPSIEGHLPSPQHLTQPRLSSKAIAMPTSPLHHRMPAQSNLAGSTEMSASWALSGSAFCSAYMGASTRQSPCPRVPKSRLHASAGVCA